MFIRSLANGMAEEKRNMEDVKSSSSEGFGTVPNDAERFGNVQNASEDFGSVPNDAERGGRQNEEQESSTLQTTSIRTEFHTLTVKEAARQFEEGGVARTERSITNWCRPNKDGVPRLDCYFDRNERRYFITVQSVNAVVEEEKARMGSQKKSGTESASNSTVRNDADVSNASERNGTAEPGQVERPNSGHADVDDLKTEMEFLRVDNQVKEAWIKELRSERKEFLSSLRKADYHIGKLETQLQLEAPRTFQKGSEQRAASEMALPPEHFREAAVELKESDSESGEINEMPDRDFWETAQSNDSQSTL